MKKTLLFSFILFFINIQIAKAQQENDPCSAPCLSFSGSTSGANPPADGFSPNVNLPCGSGHSEDNPTWFTFVPSGNSFKITVTASSCIGDSTGAQFTIYKGDDCGSIEAIGCVILMPTSPTSSKTDTLTVATVPCRQYWIQVDGYAEAVCNFTIAYNPNQLLKTVTAPLVTGEKNVCLGTTQIYTATLPNGCKPSDYTWGTIPAGKAVMTNNGDGTVEVKWTSVGVFKFTAKPKFALKCPPMTIASTPYDVTVYELKTTKCADTICCENIPFNFPILQCLKKDNPNITGITDPVYGVVSQACGSTKTNIFTYEIPPGGCIGKIEVTSTVKPKSIPMAFTSNIKNSTGKNGAIDLTVTSTKTTTFLWSNGATTEDIFNLAPGNYCVTVTDVESCFKYECFFVKDVTTSEETETSRAISVFPNPVNDILFIKINENIILTKIELLDTKGSVLSVLSSETRQINMINLPSAVYFLKCYTKDDFVVKRIVK